MWTRPELKSKAKEALKKNYLKCIIVALILLIVGGGLGNSNSNKNEDENAVVEFLEKHVFTALETIEGTESIDSFSDALIVIVIVFLAILFIGILFTIFVANVIEVGGCKFFIDNATDYDTGIRKIFSGFTGGTYWRNVSVQFYKLLYTFLWTLLFIIPGIIKAYEYLMVPYIIADNPDISKEDAFAISKRMMDGNKLDTFILQLSFIGWEFLSGITFGLVGILYSNPYKRATYAELYLKLKSIEMPNQQNVYDL